MPGFQPAAPRYLHSPHTALSGTVSSPSAERHLGPCYCRELTGKAAHCLLAVSALLQFEEYSNPSVPRFHTLTVSVFSSKNSETCLWKIILLVAGGRDGQQKQHEGKKQF